MDFKPGKGKVLVRVEQAEKTSLGGIILAEDAVENTNRAKVLAVGDGVITDAGVKIDIAVNVGDTIMYYNGTGQAVQLGGEELLILREEDMFAIVEE